MKVTRASEKQAVQPVSRLGLKQVQQEYSRAKPLHYKMDQTGIPSHSRKLVNQGQSVCTVAQSNELQSREE